MTRLELVDSVETESCGLKTKAGKNMPVNPELVNYKAVPGGKERIVTPEGVVVAGEKCSVDEAEGCGYISHFATCSRR